MTIESISIWTKKNRRRTRIFCVFIATKNNYKATGPSLRSYQKQRENLFFKEIAGATNIKNSWDLFPVYENFATSNLR